MFSRNRYILLFIVALLVTAVGFWVIDRRQAQLGVLTVHAGALGGDVYFLMSELAEVVERHSDLIRLKVVANDRINNERSDGLGKGIDLATIQSHAPALPETMFVAELYREVFQLFTRADTGIKTIRDLQGRKLALPPDGSSALTFFWAIGDHYDLFVQDVNWESMDERRAVTSLLNGDVEAMFTVGTERHLATLKLIEEFDLAVGVSPLRMIGVEQAPAMGIKRPYIQSVPIEKGTFDGDPPIPAERLVTGGVRRSLVASTNANPDHIAELTRILFENRSDLLVRFPLANQIEAPQLSGALRMPLHPGALRYYTRDEPSFIQENAEPLALLVAVLTMVGSLVFALRSNFSATQKNLADRFNHDVLAIGQKLHDVKTKEEWENYRQELDELLNKAVHALDEDEVTDAGFQSFAFLWQTVAKDLDERRVK